MYNPKSIYTEVALAAIVAKVKNKESAIPDVLKNNSQLLDVQSCFVSIHLKNGDLRGCIGTIKPVEKNLYHEILRNAEAACTRDSRFRPVSEEELENLKVSVDVLSVPEEIQNVDDLDAEKYGIIISDGAFRRGVLLPNIPTVDSVDEQIRIVKRKAGIVQNSNHGLIIERFTSTRYH